MPPWCGVRESRILPYRHRPPEGLGGRVAQWLSNAKPGAQSTGVPAPGFAALNPGYSLTAPVIPET